MPQTRSDWLRWLALLIILLLYMAYLGFIISSDQGPVDYETFMHLGQRLLRGEPIYTENSYYPLPYVMIFAAFSAMPRAVSMALWLGLPVMAALVVTRFSPLTLLFAPVMSHFLGGQSSMVGLLGLWGYRKHPDSRSAVGGVWLAVTTLKPQLGIFIILWACAQWWRMYRQTRRIPRQMLAFVATTAILYIPSFLIMPDWFFQWLAVMRGLSTRALSSLVPRSLLYTIGQGSLYWVLLIAIALVLLALIWQLHRRRLTLDLFVVWSFVISPLVNDYDLIQLTALLDTTARRIVAVLLSIPGWLVIVFAYGDDPAWFWFTIVAPGLLMWLLWERLRPTASPASPSR